MRAKLTPRQDRLRCLYAYLDRIADEITVLLNAEAQDSKTPVRRLQPMPCGTERAYQRHRHYHQTCTTCKAAHAAHNRAKDAARRGVA